MAYAYIPARLQGGDQDRVNRIVIHATVSPCVRGGARNVARYFQSQEAGGSAHYVVDSSEIVQCVKDGTVAYHAPPNTDTLGVELCDPQAGPASRWEDAAHVEMLARAAGLVRQLAARHNVPLVRLSVADLKAGKRGICGHVDVSNAFKRSDHGDPGSGFPWDDFLGLVREEMEDDMQLDTKIPVGGTYDKDFSATSYPASFVMIGSFGEAKRGRILAEKNAAELASVRADLAEIKALLAAQTA